MCDFVFKWTVKKWKKKVNCMVCPLHLYMCNHDKYFHKSLNFAFVFHRILSFEFYFVWNSFFSLLCCFCHQYWPASRFGCCACMCSVRPIKKFHCPLPQSLSPASLCSHSMGSFIDWQRNCRRIKINRIHTFVDRQRASETGCEEKVESSLLRPLGLKLNDTRFGCSLFPIRRWRWLRWRRRQNILN